MQPPPTRELGGRAGRGRSGLDGAPRRLPYVGTEAPVSLKPRLNTHLWGSLEPPSSNVHRSLPQAPPACGRAGILGLPLPGRGTPLVFTQPPERRKDLPFGSVGAVWGAFVKEGLDSYPACPNRPALPALPPRSFIPGAQGI